STETWYDRHGEPFQPGVHYFVGGATKMYGAALYRLRREDFGEIRHYDGVSPAWPLAYEEMEPYYTKAEQMYHVHGARGEDPTELPAVTLLTHALVRTRKTNAAGTAVTEVVVEREGQTESYRGGIVVVSCGAANSAKLLLQSANDRHPRGLANGSDQVGRHYMFHNSMAVLAISREPNPTRYQKTLGLNDFYFGMNGFEYPMGNIQMVGKSQGPMYKGEKPIEAGLVPGWALEKLAEHAVDFWLSTEDLPSPDNRVTLARDGRIQLNYIPNNQVPKQRLFDKLRSMLDRLDLHEHLIPRNLYMKNEIGIGGVAHQAGTCRFGTDPGSSVLDTHCKAHELDNLYVVDTAF